MVAKFNIYKIRKDKEILLLQKLEDAGMTKRGKKTWMVLK